MLNFPVGSRPALSILYNFHSPLPIDVSRQSPWNHCNLSASKWGIANLKRNLTLSSRALDLYAPHQISEDQSTSVRSEYICLRVIKRLTSSFVFLNKWPSSRLSSLDNNDLFYLCTYNSQADRTSFLSSNGQFF